MGQTSLASETIFDTLVCTFSSSADSHKLANLDELKSRSGVSEEDWQGVLAYTAQVSSLGDPFQPIRRSSSLRALLQVLSNLANFKS